MDIQQELKQRIEALTQEGQQVAQAAARQATAPYEAAISELKRLLDKIEQENDTTKEFPPKDQS